MSSFKEFLKEASIRKDGIIYNGARLIDGDVDPAIAKQKLHDGCTKVVSALRLKKVVIPGIAMMLIIYAYDPLRAEATFGIPDKLDADEADFFIKMAVKAFTAHVAKPHNVIFRTRYSLMGLEDFLEAIARRGKPYTDRDMIRLEFYA